MKCINKIPLISASAGTVKATYIWSNLFSGSSVIVIFMFMATWRGGHLGCAICKKKAPCYDILRQTTSCNKGLIWPHVRNRFCCYKNFVRQL